MAATPPPSLAHQQMFFANHLKRCSPSFGATLSVFTAATTTAATVSPPPRHQNNAKKKTSKEPSSSTSEAEHQHQQQHTRAIDPIVFAIQAMTTASANQRQLISAQLRNPRDEWRHGEFPYDPWGVENLATLYHLSCEEMDLSAEHRLRCTGLKAFSSSTLLRRLVLPKTVEYVRSDLACYNANLVELDISLTSIQNLQFGACFCPNLKILKLPKKTLRKLSHCFSGLETLEVPNGVHTLDLSDMPELRELTLPRAKPVNLGVAFLANCPKLERVVFPSSWAPGNGVAQDDEEEATAKTAKDKTAKKHQPSLRQSQFRRGDVLLNELRAKRTTPYEHTKSASFAAIKRAFSGYQEKVASAAARKNSAKVPPKPSSKEEVKGGGFVLPDGSLVSSVDEVVAYFCA